MENVEPASGHIDAEEAYEKLTLTKDAMEFLASAERPWNAALWRREFLAASGSPAGRLRKGKLLALVARSTVEICRVGQYLNAAGHPVGLSPPSSLCTLCTDFETTPIDLPGACCVTIVNQDCVDAAVELVQSGFRPALLNMANAESAGGGWKTGAAAQEEDLFRRSDYHLRVDEAHYQHPHFPLHDRACIYTPGVRYFRRGKEDGYAFMEDSAAIATIACAAYVRPATAGARLVKEKEDGTLAKLRSVFNAARSQAHDSLVLSAFGCGAFGNPPHAIASLMKQVCEENRARFKKIVVAIVEDDGCRNLEPFEQVFNLKAQRASGAMTSISRVDTAGTDTNDLDQILAESCDDAGIIEEDSAEPDSNPTTSSSVVGNNGQCGHYSLQQLQERHIWSNLGIDPAKRHLYLPDATFFQLFAMSKDDFEKLPKWKAKQLKIKHLLY